MPLIAELLDQVDHADHQPINLESTDRTSWIFCPSAVLFSNPVPLRNTPSTILLRTPGEAVWLMTINSHPWNEKLVRLAMALLDEIGDAWTVEALEVRLADRLEMPSVRVIPARFLRSPSASGVPGGPPGISGPWS